MAVFNARIFLAARGVELQLLVAPAMTTNIVAELRPPGDAASVVRNDRCRLAPQPRQASHNPCNRPRSAVELAAPPKNLALQPAAAVLDAAVLVVDVGDEARCERVTAQDLQRFGAATFQ